MPIKKSGEKVAKTAPKSKKPTAKVKQPDKKTNQTKKTEGKKTPVKKPEAAQELKKPIKLAVMLFEMQMHSVSKHLLTDKQRKSLSKKLENHRDKTRESCLSFLDGKREERAKGIRSLAVAYFLKVSKKKEKKIQEAVKKTFQTF